MVHDRTASAGADTADPLRRADEALHEERDRLRVTLSSIGDAVITADAEGRVTFLNPVAESLTGWLLPEAAAQPLDRVFRIINEDSRQPVASAAVRALREGVVVGLANHSLLVGRDGTERPIDDSAAPIRNGQGEVAGVVLVFRDITERRQTEQEMQHALAYANDILATLREPFVVLDGHLRVRSANRSFYESFQVSQEETENRLIYELGNGQWNIPSLRALLDDVLSEHHPVQDYVVEHDFPAIGRRNMLLNARQFPPEAENPELILLAIEDITEHKQAEAAVKASEVRYRRLFESARDGILILDAGTMRIVDANPFMYELLSYSREQFIGKELWEIGLFEDKSESQTAVRTLKETGYVRYEDLPLESKQGKTRQVEFICNVYKEGGQEVAQCNIRDITQRKQMERRIQEQAKELADASRRKDQFLAMLSHELRNPMAPIFNALQLMGREGGENDLQREARGVIERQVRHLSKLVDDLLEVSRIATGRIRLHIERVDLNGILQKAVERLRPDIDRRQQQLAVTLADGVVWVDADTTRLEQIIGNLLNNASKYNNPGGHIWLSVGAQDEQAVIRVQDDGIGMAPELLPHIFDMFTQADKSLDRSEGGLGIGLALVKSLVELQHGTVEVHTEGIGRGCEFVVRLPLAAERPASQQEAASPQPPTAATDTLRILVVDDSVDAAKMSAMLLRTWGHEVRTAHNGPDALQRATGFHPHVILCDIGLPGMDGYEVARHIRHSPHLKDVRLVAVTGYGQDSDRQRSQEAGFDHHLVKPVESPDLQALLTGFHPAPT